jgi:hypothetical protein
MQTHLTNDDIARIQQSITERTAAGVSLDDLLVIEDEDWGELGAITRDEAESMIAEWAADHAHPDDGTPDDTGTDNATIDDLTPARQWLSQVATARSEDEDMAAMAADRDAITEAAD